MASTSSSSTPSAASGGGDGLRSMIGDCVSAGGDELSFSTCPAPSAPPSEEINQGTHYRNDEGDYQPIFWCF